MFLPLFFSSLFGAAQAADGPAVQVYGIVKPTIAVTAGSFDSYGRPNESAITSAGNPLLVADAARLRGSWQVAQSRFGLKVGGPKAGAQLELDFVDFNVATPTVSAKPRLRIATVRFAPSARTSFTLGQTWDAFAPLQPFHRNLVGGSFQAGNLGFMRHQAILEQAAGPLTVVAAAGFVAANNGLGDTAVETNPTPTGALRLVAPAGGKKRIHLGGFAGKVPFTDTDHTLAWGTALGAELPIGERTALKGEAYVGQNLANTGMLTLGQGSFDAVTRKIADVREFGGWLSLRQALAGPLALTITAHGAKVIDTAAVLPATLPGATADDPALPNPAAGPGMTHNAGGRLGLEAAATPALTFYGEGFGLSSAFAAAPGAGRGADLSPLRFGTEWGAVYTF
jgi:hypothetical protein